MHWRRWMWIAAAVIIVAGFAAWGPIVSQVDEPPYHVQRVEQPFELRVYAPMLVAEVRVKGERDEAINQGFRLLADYIFGNNTSAKKLAMTAPVTQQEASTKIPMTAPVLQQQEGDNVWQVRFVMPANYKKISELPQPNNPEVQLLHMPERRFAVIRFSGSSAPSNLDEHRQLLAEYVTNKGLKPIGEPVLAFYNPPWTLPFLRRNEVLQEIK
ncbi:MAG: heme-binding protein [Rickettsiales bacterium]|nr:heme-binding protein [Rickettsiales bacterium]